MAKLKSLVKDLERGLKEATREAAADIQLDLKLNGPYWTGEFEGNWVARVGQVNIPATKDGPEERPKTPEPRAITPPVVPNPKGLNGYTIGNLSSYRDVALDLLPGRIKKEGGGTARQDWYDLYLTNQIDKTIGKAVDRSLEAEGFSR